MTDSITRLAILAVTAGLAASGCATVFEGTDQEVGLQSRPAGAHVSVIMDGVPIAERQAPATVQLKKGHTVALVFELPGYRPVNVLLNKNLSGGMIADLALGGRDALFIDMANGAAWTYDETVYVNLETGLASNSPDVFAPAGKAIAQGPIPNCHLSETPQWKAADTRGKKRLLDECRRNAAVEPAPVVAPVPPVAAAATE